jgi:hypothetical protein
VLEVKNRIKLIKKKHKLVKRDQVGIPSLGSKSFKRVLLAVFMAYLPLNEIQAHTIGAKTSKLKPAQTEYHCKKTDETIVIDGKLDENIWRQTPSVKFYGIVDGSKPPFITVGKIIWDENYLYFGFYLERPDITCNWTKHDKAMGKAVAKDVFSKLSGTKLNTEIWGQGECMIMKIDSFAKIFLDPDGDGSNYLEFHINPANNVFDAWYKQGFDPGRRKRDRFPRIDWKCPGLLTATHIDGTLNNSSDVDRGWGIEVAIPWQALKPFTRGACPPKNGDIWGVHTGRVYRDRQGGRNKYWVFPFLEVWNCHFPDRYAKLIFQDDVPKFERFFAFSVTPDEGLIRKAADIGVTDVTGNYSEKLARLCKKYGLKFYPIVKVSPGECRKYFADKKIPCQKMTPEQEVMQKLLKGEIVHQDSGNEYATTPKTPDNWQLTEEQKKLLTKMTKKIF